VIHPCWNLFDKAKLQIRPLTKNCNRYAEDNQTERSLIPLIPLLKIDVDLQNISLLAGHYTLLG